MRLWNSDKKVIGILLNLVLMLLLLPLRWLLAVAIVALLHELGHYCAVRLFGGDVHTLRFGYSGAVMEANGLTLKSELICLLAGPIAGLLPSLIFRRVPIIALCGLIQSAYNLLPIYPLDGGKIVRNVIFMAGGTDRCFRAIEHTVIVILFLFCAYLKLRFGVSLFLFVAVFLFRKTPCKLRQD